VLLGGLRRLEYRGYDSAGLAILDGALRVAKQSGKVASLDAAIANDWSRESRQRGGLGIAHTRWATHGAPITRNAHPHGDRAGRLALVHNGIVENYGDLKTRLRARGHEFLSETDTEVLAHLVGHYCDEGAEPLEALGEALRQAQGTFGIALLDERHPDSLYVARQGSPLVIGVGVGETVVASDAAAIIQHTDRVIYLEDGDMATVGAGTVDIRNLGNTPVTRGVTRIEWDLSAAEKGGHAHFMAKEIAEQPDALRNAIRGRLEPARGAAVLAGLGLTFKDMAEIERITLVGCGTSRHAGMVAEYYFEELAGIPTDVEQAAEFRYRNPLVGARHLVVAISQSGETADTLAALREAKAKGATVTGLCNVVGSTLARECGRGIYLHAGPEIGVASTKAFTSQVTVLLMMALKFARGRRLSLHGGAELCRALEDLPDAVGTVLARAGAIAALASRFEGARSAFYIGRGLMYPVALEGALKLKEISYLHAEGYQAAELKHGPIAMLESGVPVVALVPDIGGRKKTIGNIQECRARHAPVIAVITDGDEELRHHADAVIEIPRTHPLLTPITAAVALQLLAYQVALARGCEIDQPRNLAKSVTVE
jgi:glucosamine--fructose-6-phosphate aminotransferase (isomerizing)